MAADLLVRNLVIPASELTWSAVRSSGPGGQNVNKVASKVELRFDFEASDALPAPVKARLRALAANRLDAEGRILITNQETRNQLQNREAAREKLAELIAKACVVPKKRRPIKPSKAAKRERVRQKRVHAERKQSRKRVVTD